MGIGGTLTLVLLAVLTSAAIFNSVDAQKTTLLFAFGDSYADVGNRAKRGPNVGKGWVYPYGITWPQPRPAGRYSDGKTQTDWFADLLGLPIYPPPYLYSAGQDTSSGVNFAVGGSGVVYDNGQVSLGAQVDNFELFLRTDPYSKAELANSLTLVSVVGNDYLYFTGKTSAELFVFIERVVSGIQANLQRLYDLGLRNVMVANMFEIDCMPAFTASNGYTKCTGDYIPFVQVHNAFLLGAVQSINTNNPGARFIILDQFATFNRLITDGRNAGFKDGLKPCCAGTSNVTSCGDVDPSGKWLYTVCKHRGEAIFWDQMHPTMWAWHYIVGLYINEPRYLLLADAPTLKQWLQINDAVQEPVAAPMAPPDLSSAAGQVQAAFNYLLDKPQYSEALGLLQSLNMDALLSQYSSQVVTVFLPTNDAFTATDRAFIDRVFAQNKVNDVALYHVVKGYYDVNALVTGKPSSLASMTGEQVPVFYPPQGVFVGVNQQAKVIDGNLYTAPGQMVIHGIDHVLMPSGV
ncbi:hypothetical protein M758_2G229300 [Ceratodon purpureus]|uniref:FAS1 domain-containing protein n=1 Tax=Ceratodon purpureus TaxID=3225 RepID=A0A8T0J1W5_CERPU|nr:hypothetical protein KC19_2G275500 [Ceratodon purpureus]KAG0627804.1 hypothetical protein M758_2G229300 [Ceratodon purpureus]